MKTFEIIAKELNRRHGQFDPTEIRPSAIGHCARQEVYRVLGYEGNPDAMKALQGVAYLGHIIEENLALLYAQEFDDAVPQYEIETPYGVKAHCDIWVPSLQRDIEVKSISVKAKKYGLPKDEHLKQLMLRLHLNKKYLGADPVGEIVYFFRETMFDPETMAPVVIPVYYDPIAGQELEDRLLWIMQCIDNHVLPEQEGRSPDHYPCKSSTTFYDVECPYRELCWEVVEEEPAKPASVGLDLVKRYVELQDKRNKLNFEVKALTEEMQEIEERLNAIFEQEKADKLAFGQWEVKKTLVPGGKVEYERKDYVRWYIKQRRDK